MDSQDCEDRFRNVMPCRNPYCSRSAYASTAIGSYCCEGCYKAKTNYNQEACTKECSQQAKEEAEWLDYFASGRYYLFDTFLEEHDAPTDEEDSGELKVPIVSELGDGSVTYHPKFASYNAALYYIAHIWQATPPGQEREQGWKRWAIGKLDR